MWLQSHKAHNNSHYYSKLLVIFFRIIYTNNDWLRCLDKGNIQIADRNQRRTDVNNSAILATTLLRTKVTRQQITIPSELHWGISKTFPLSLSHKRRVSGVPKGASQDQKFNWLPNRNSLKLISIVLLH